LFLGKKYSYYQVQASAETIAERVDRFANQMRQLERQAINIINVSIFVFVDVVVVVV
jgi:hypothetical protein